MMMLLRWNSKTEVAPFTKSDGEQIVDRGARRR
jgi:hypothetical protein